MLENINNDSKDLRIMKAYGSQEAAIRVETMISKYQPIKQKI